VPPNPANALAPGDRLGPYTIVGLLGAGGMGEVYRAHDARLKRDVALKVLRRTAADAAHVARFSREARAAGSLNHPNILAVFDVDTEAGTPYVVSELLEGETLRARMDRGRLPYRKALDYGIQIAQALDAAHAKGIWHRDIKPGNAFITSDGRVKLLDFGLAKLSERDGESAAEDTTHETTRKGDIWGTPGYMSPEQVLAGAIDHRTDIFSLGAVLYEMVTGARAFHRPSSVQTMTAVLQDDPADPLTLNAGLPPAAVAVVRRCLEKDKEERFQSARDLAFALKQLRDGGQSSAAAEPAPAPRRRKALAVVLAVGLLVEALAIGWLLLRPAATPSFEQLTFRRGRIGGARFASDGQAVVYSEAGAGNALEVWRTDLVDSPQSRSLDYPVGSDVLAARAGELALSVRRRFVQGERFVGTLALAPLGGGAPREVMENVEDADWDPSGAQLAIARSTGDVGGQSWIEYGGRTLYKTPGSIRFLRVSRDGQRIAFLEDLTGRGVSGSVLAVDLDGRVTRLTDDWPSLRGLAWSPGGGEIWFTAGDDANPNRALRAVDLKGNVRLLSQAPGSLTLWDITSDGHVLLTRDEERRAVIGVPPGETVERDLSWFDNAAIADLSADGRWLLFGDRFGLYIRATDGSPPVHLGLRGAFADHISPDGKTILATTAQTDQLLLVPIGAGTPRPLSAEGISGYSGAMWFPDGQRILFNAREAGRNLRSYVQAISGGPPEPLTPEDTRVISISPDGAWAAAIGAGQAISLWPLAGGAPQAVKGTEPGERPVAWSADGRSLWLFRRGEVPANVYSLEIASGRRQLWRTLVPPDAAGVYSIIDFRVTPTGHSYFYSYTRLLSQLFTVSGVL
jgi:hypothetical protein